MPVFIYMRDITIGCLVLALVVYGLTIIKIIKPFKKILSGISRIETGNLEQSINVKTNIVEVKLL